jgi:2-dehydro-3-deoxyphosphogluconate aldolase/(4S)-4-hydroxy-2-oxoglutarate aldolase
MKKAEAISLIQTSGVIAILRAKSSSNLLKAADALRAGGICAIEVTMTTPGALSIIEQAAAKYDAGVLFGAGSVLDAESARAAVLAGAGFIVAPSLKVEVIEICRRYSVPVCPGAYTPTEIVTTWESGADMVKIFPASVGGPDLIKALKAPLPQVEMVAVGGVELENTSAFIRAGATAVGVGSSLVNDRLLEAGEFEEITARAKRFSAEVQKGREPAR